MACGILEGEFATRLRSRLRQGYPAGYLDLAQAYNALQTSIQQGRLQASDNELARLMFLVSINGLQCSETDRSVKSTFTFYIEKKTIFKYLKKNYFI